MSLDQVLDSMAGVLATELPELKTSELAGGRFNLEELQRRSKALPAAFVACTATRDGRLQGKKFHCRGFFLVVLAVQSRAEGQPVAQDRARAIASLLGRTMRKIAGAKNWGNAEVSSIPEKVASMNPYSTAADKNNLALWGITWEQDLELADNPAPAAPPDLTSIHADWKMVESTNDEDAEDDVDTTQENP